MRSPLLSWGAQVAAHAAYVEAHHRTPPAPAPSGSESRRRGAAHREQLLHALRDGKPHRFGDLAAALPGLSRQGAYWLCDRLKAEGRIDWTNTNRSNRLYRLTQGDRHD